MTQNKLKVVNEILELIRYNGVGDDLGQDYMQGYNDAVDDIVIMIEDYYENSSSK